MDQFQRRMKSEKNEETWATDLSQAITDQLATFVHLATDVLHYFEDTLLPCDSVPSLLATFGMYSPGTCSPRHCFRTHPTTEFPDSATPLTEEKIQEIFQSARPSESS